MKEILRGKIYTYYFSMIAQLIKKVKINSKKAVFIFITIFLEFRQVNSMEKKCNL